MIETVENTYIPERNGMRREITKAGKSRFDGVVVNGPLAGKKVSGDIPTRVKDVLAVTDTEATYLLDQSLLRLKGHTVTVRVVKAPGETYGEVVA